MGANINTRINLQVDKGTPVLFYRGDFDPKATYVYNYNYRDYVRYIIEDQDGTKTTYYFTVRNRWDELTGIIPDPFDTSSGRRWEKASQLGFLAAGAITADMIDVDSLVVKNLRTSPTRERIEISSSTNSIKAYDSANTEVLSIKGGQSDIELSKISELNLNELSNRAVLLSSGTNTWTYTFITFPSDSDSLILPKLMMTLESSVVLSPIKIRIKVIQGSFSQTVYYASRVLNNGKKSSLSASFDSILLNPVQSTEIRLEIEYYSGSTSGTLIVNANWGGVKAQKYKTQRVTELSSNGIILSSGGSYYRMKRSGNIVNILSRNVKSSQDGYILSGSYDPEKGITFSHGDDFYVDDSNTGQGWVITHNLGTSAYSVIANIVNNNFQSTPYGLSIIVTRKTDINFTIMILRSSGALANYPFDFVMYGKRKE